MYGRLCITIEGGIVGEKVHVGIEKRLRDSI